MWPFSKQEPARASVAAESSELIFVNRFFHPDNAATSQLLSDLCFDLANDGRHIKVITSRRSYSHPGTLYPAQESLSGVEVTRLKTTDFGRLAVFGKIIDFLSFYLLASFAIFLQSKPNSVVVVMTDPPLFSFVVRMLSRLKGFRQVNWLQDIYPDIAIERGMGKRLRPLFGLLTRARDASMRKAWRNVVIGERMKDKLLSWGVPADSIRVIPNWSDVGPTPTHGPGARPLRAAWSLEGKFVVMYSGNLGHAHDTQAICRVIERLKDEPDLVFLFVGSGAGMAELKTQMSHIDRDRLVFKPYVARELLSESLSIGDVHLISLRPELEGLIVPSKVYGVLGVGRPFVFIGSSNGELATMAQQHQVGMFAEPEQTEHLAHAIRQYKSHPEVRTGHGKNALELFRKDFTKSRSMARWRQSLRPDFN